MKMYDVETHVISFGYSSIVVTHLLLIAVHQRYQHSSGRKRMIHCFNLPVYNSRVELQRSLETACHTYIHGEELFIFFTREEDAKEVVRGTRSVREYIFPSTLSLFCRSPFSSLSSFPSSFNLIPILFSPLYNGCCPPKPGYH